MAIKKMKIEAKQIAAKNAKELEINQNKFEKQMEDMNAVHTKQLNDKNREILAQDGGRE